jgi:uncharacterized protein (DUF1810 family)
MTNPYDLKRFLDAQEPVIEQVRRELRSGRKMSHWMWFIFPQIKGLGHSDTARRYAISSRAEAVTYLAHPVLGERLRECTRLVTLVEGRTVSEIFGYPDDLKFHSCMTLFANVTKDNEVFIEDLDKYYSGERDRATLEMLAKPESARSS